jgi:hypothetical protein
MASPCQSSTLSNTGVDWQAAKVMEPPEAEMYRRGLELIEAVQASYQLQPPPTGTSPSGEVYTSAIILVLYRALVSAPVRRVGKAADCLPFRVLESLPFW